MPTSDNAAAKVPCISNGSMIPELESVLELENDKYREGFSDGKNQPTREQFLEGREYGIQTGFQRALVVGYIKGLAQSWRTHASECEARGFSGHLDQLDSLLDSITFSNEEDAVANYEKTIQKARNKLRLVANMAGQSWKVADLDRILGQVGGQMRVSTNSDEMW